MSQVVSAVFATLVTMPVAAFMIAFSIGKKLLKRKKKSFHLAVNVSTIFFILAVHFFIVVLWGKSYFWLLIIFLLILKMLFTIGYWRTKQDLHLPSVFRLFWRFNFLLFSSAYFCLVIYGLITRIADNM